MRLCKAGRHASWPKRLRAPDEACVAVSSDPAHRRGRAPFLQTRTTNAALEDPHGMQHSRDLKHDPATLERMLAGGGQAAIKLMREAATASLKFGGERCSICWLTMSGRLPACDVPPRQSGDLIVCIGDGVSVSARLTQRSVQRRVDAGRPDAVARCFQHRRSGAVGFQPDVLALAASGRTGEGLRPRRVTDGHLGARRGVGRAQTPLPSALQTARGATIDAGDRCPPGGGNPTRFCASCPPAPATRRCAVQAWSESGNRFVQDAVSSHPGAAAHYRYRSATRIDGSFATLSRQL